jgi:hypothetical protein
LAAYDHIVESLRLELGNWYGRAENAERIINDVASYLPPIREGGHYWHSEIPQAVARLGGAV